MIARYDTIKCGGKTIHKLFFKNGNEKEFCSLDKLFNFVNKRKVKII